MCLNKIKQYNIMTNFSFSNPVKIIFGKDTIKKISEEIPSGAKILIIYGGGSIFKNGVYDQVKSALKNFEVYEFGGIEPNPHFETCMNAVELVKEKNIDFLLAVGGGSVIDATKFIAIASFADYDAWEIMSKRKLPSQALPLGTILTLPATGSEMNSGAVITHTALQEKRDFNTPLIFPKFSVLDPETTFSLPPEQVANGVVDTFVHVTEQYLTYPVGAKVQDYFSESILRILTEEGPKALVDPTNYNVRANLMWASTWALNGWISKGVPEDWATHMIGHEITAFHGLDHGQTLAIVLPGLLDVMRNEKGDKIVQMGENVFHVRSGTKDQKISGTIFQLDSFFHSMGTCTRLSDYGLGSAVIDPIVERFKDRGWKLGENRNITPEKIRLILEKRL
jgi:NADP-dependent alcohol dehydrogenase